MMTVKQALAQFRENMKKLETIYGIEEISHYAYVISPQKVNGKEAKKIDLTLGAITHGNETAGLAVINRFLLNLRQKLITLRTPVGVFLGNDQAALMGQRFIESDLNRSFGRQSWITQEHKRAQQLETILSQTRWFIDFHQTTMPAEQPFFIFPYTAKSLQFARAILPELAIVTHWGKGFSHDGLCTDEFVNHQGGVGISVELGQAGFNSDQESLGWQIITNALLYLHDEAEVSEVMGNKIYTFAHSPVFAHDDFPRLDPGWTNMQDVSQGQRLGVDAKQKVIHATTTGKMLFPKYPPPGTPRPQEPYRIIKEISMSDLPKDKASVPEGS